MTEPAYEFHGPERSGPWLITCDHASNHVPASVNGGTLGLSDTDMQRHIAYDVGAAGVTRHLADLLDAPAILGRFSRLVIDPNRGEDDPTLMMRLYDGTIIPGNRQADAAEIARRKALFYDPYHTALTDLAARLGDPLLVAVHSFTPRLNGRHPRPWHVGILHADDQRLSRPLIELLRSDAALADALPDEVGEPWCVGENQPYAGHLPGDSVDRHALKPGRANALIELRHDLIDTEAGQRRWAERLAPLLDAARQAANL